MKVEEEEEEEEEVVQGKIAKENVIITSQTQFVPESSISSFLSKHYERQVQLKFVQIN